MAAEAPVAAQAATMGVQSQRRNNQATRATQLAQTNKGKKRKKGDQRTISGGIAFDQKQHCPVCKAKAAELKPPHVSHHNLCPLKQTNVQSVATAKSHAFSKGLATLFSTPLPAHEKASGRPTQKDKEVFFAPQKPPPPPTTTTTPTTPPTTTQTMALTAEYFCKEVAAKMDNRGYCCVAKAKEAPLPIQAFDACVFK